MKRLRKAKNCEIILNYDCNARCPFCYHSQEQIKEFSYRMPFQDVAKALYEGRKNGAFVAYLIGGETTLHPDLPKIAAFARKVGYPYIQVLSNGLKLADFKYVKKLTDSGVNLFRLSVHGPNEKIHDKLVGVEGAFRKIMKAAENIERLGAEITVNHALNKVNYKCIEDTLKLLTKKMGVSDFNIIFPHYTGTMKEHLDMLQVRVSETLPYVRSALRFLEKNKIEVENAIFINFTPCNLPEAVHLMTEWEEPQKDLRDETMYHLEGYKNRIYELAGKLRRKNRTCVKCIYNKRCLGFEKWYFEMFGGKEYRPVLKPRKQLNIKPTYRKLKEFARRLNDTTRA